MISLIAAMSKNRVIGVDNQLPWHLPADLKHFKALTLNKPIIMGRKTYESIGRPLPKRRNIIISRQAGYIVENCDVYSTLEAAFAATHDAEETMVIGGANVYQQALPLADRIYLTIVDTTLEGDAYFPEWSDAWEVCDDVAHQRDDNNPFNYRFLTLCRKTL